MIVKSDIVLNACVCLCESPAGRSFPKQIEFTRSATARILLQIVERRSK